MGLKSMNVKIKKLHPDAVIPKYAKDGDAGMDLVSISMNDDHTDYIEYGTGLAIEIPEGYVGLIFPRSSISYKSHVLTNSVGVIDGGYRGEIKFRFKRVLNLNSGVGNYYNVGEKVGQLIIMPYPQIELQEVEELSNTERGTGAFGSSGS